MRKLLHSVIFELTSLLNFQNFQEQEAAERFRHDLISGWYICTGTFDHSGDGRIAGSGEAINPLGIAVDQATSVRR